MSLFTLTIVASVVLFIAVGNFAGRRVKNLDDYLVAGRRAPTLLIVGTLVASLMSTTVFMGEAGFTYAGQLGPYLLLPGLTVTGYVYGALFFGTYLRRSQATTVAAFFGERFDDGGVQRLAGLTIILGLGGYLLVVTQGAALLIADADCPPDPAVVLPVGDTEEVSVLFDFVARAWVERSGRFNLEQNQFRYEVTDTTVAVVDAAV